jgi:hypothetical protein
VDRCVGVRPDLPGETGADAMGAGTGGVGMVELQSAGLDSAGLGALAGTDAARPVTTGGDDTGRLRRLARAASWRALSCRAASGHSGSVRMP